MATILSASSHNIHRMEVPQQGPNTTAPEGLNLSPTAKKVAVLALICFAAFLIIGPTFIIKTTSLIIGLGCIGLIFYTVWKNGEQQPEGIRILRSSNNPNPNIPTGTHTTVGGGHTPSQVSHTGVGSGHNPLPAKKTTTAPAQTGTGHTQVGGGHQNSGFHTQIGSRAKK